MARHLHSLSTDISVCLSGKSFQVGADNGTIEVRERRMLAASDSLPNSQSAAGIVAPNSYSIAPRVPSHAHLNSDRRFV
jgi:hypothetical protein